jgi:hypothetical protein
MFPQWTNETGVRNAAINRSYHLKPQLLSPFLKRIEFLDHTGIAQTPSRLGGMLNYYYREAVDFSFWTVRPVRRLPADQLLYERRNGKFVLQITGHPELWCSFRAR